jgi:hypothetical protein
MTRSSAFGVRSRLIRAGLPASALAGMVALALFASACGGSSGAGVAQVGSTPTRTTGAGSTSSASPNESKRGALVAFSACMRRNGVPNFPDPKPAGRGFRLTFGSDSGIDVSSPRFKNAQQTCKKLLPGGGKSDARTQAVQLRQALEYAACMRSHGVPKFPDPKSSSDGGIDMGTLGPRVGADPRSPQFKAAERACKELAPGAGGGESRSQAP